MTAGFVLGSQYYEGSVASRARVTHHNPDVSNNYVMSRSAHISSELLTAIRVVFSNFYTDSGGADAGPGAASTIAASVEYPAGTFTQLKFATLASGSVSDANVLFSDYVNVFIPSNTVFWVRIFSHNTAGVLYNQWQNSFLGEACILSSTVIADQTMSGTVINSGSPSGVSYPPIAILGKTINPSVVIVGDSIGVGAVQGADLEDNTSSITGFNAKVGSVARSLGNIPFINICGGAQTANNWAASSPARIQLIQKGSHLICQMGANDLNNNPTSAQLVGYMQTIFALGAPFQKRYQGTITPRSTSTDSFATVGNQTAAATNTLRVAFNTAVRATLSGTNGFFDIASAVESGLNSGLWIASPTPPYTGDGLHPQNSSNTVGGYSVIQNSGVINPAVITYP